MFTIPEDWFEVTARLLAAGLLTALVGLEREIRNKPAGLRTYMLVGIGSATFGILTLQLVKDATAVSPEMAKSIDPTRIIEGIVGGLGFLGAGSIIQSQGKVGGMTTAAGIWIAGAIGVGCGVGSFFISGMATLLVLICLIPIGYLERHLPESDDVSQQTGSTTVGNKRVSGKEGDQ
jgi:putative Mg2+ transporter-C (MgtC) family protein